MIQAADAELLTRRWLEHFVIGLGLCPFAAAPFRGGRVSIIVSDARDDERLCADFLSALHDLLTADPLDVETTLLVMRLSLSAFDDYLSALGMLEALVAEAGAQGIVQIASFHPHYRFAGAAPDDPANHTNRSPLPMFHLIREDGLTAALESYTRPEDIPKRNIQRLRALGVDRIRALLASLNGER